jgi:eukaryotic-like serine/threonine-protein kinase
MIGRTISHYRVTGKLGFGGMGVVYEAEDVRLSRRVALKFLPDDLAGHADAARRLWREAQTIASLNHPNICTVYEIAEEEGAAFIAMEYVEGANLKAHMERRMLPTSEVIRIALQSALALSAAHTAGIVHRDIKPGNIMVGRTGHVKVLDFGLARRFQLSTGGRRTSDETTIPGRPMGTVNYMAPERIIQELRDPRSDLFSLGVVIYEMATGHRPFAGASVAETITNLLERDPIPLTTLSPQRPLSLERLVARLLAKRPDARCQSASEVCDVLAIMTAADV